MSFVDGRVIRQRMAKKDARMAKIAAKRLAKSAKIVGAAECLNTQTAPDRNGQTLTEGAHRVTAIPHSNSTPPVRTDNRVSSRKRFIEMRMRDGSLAFGSRSDFTKAELWDYIERLTAQLRKMDWQPIETAPKDGTKILVWNGYRRCLSYCDEFGWHRQNFIGEPLGAKDYEPETHWIPLPDPPANTEAVTP